MIQVFILGGLAIGSLFAAGCTPPKPTRPKDPDPKLDFDPKDNPLAQSFSESLAKQGISLLQLDRGYHAIKYSGVHCPDAKALWCRWGAGDKRLSAEEILEYPLDCDENFRTMIEGILGKDLQWVLDDLDPKTDFDKNIRERIESEIAEIRSILESQGLKKNSEDYLEKLAVGLHYLVTLPDAEGFPSFKKKNPKLVEQIFEELKAAGIEKYYHSLETRGGLRPKVSNYREEYSALDALQRSQGECTEMSKILYAVFRMAGLQGQFIFVEREALQLSNPDRPNDFENYLNFLPEDMHHVCLGLRLKGKLRLFDPALIDSNAQHHPFYPLSLRQYLSYDYLNHGMALSDKGESDQAIAEYDISHYLAPNFPFALLNRGVDKANQNKTDEAMADYNEIVKNHPDFYPVYINIGNILYGKNELDKAMIEYEKARQLNPKSPLLHVLIGRVWFKREQFDQAEKFYRKALELNPRLSLAHYYLGRLFHSQNKIDQAIESYGYAIYNQPDNAKALFFRGTLLLDKGHKDLAIKHFKQAIHHQPNFPEAYYNLASLFFKDQNWEQAESFFKKAIEYKPDYAEAHFFLGVTLEKRTQLDEAKKSYDKAIEHKPDYAEAYYQRALLAIKQKDWDQAEQDLNMAIKYNENYAAAYSALGWVLEQKGDDAKALANYDMAIRKNPRWFSAYINRGRIHMRQGNLDAALSDFSEAIKIDATVPQGPRNRALVYVKKREWDKALADYESVLQLNGRDRLALSGISSLFIQKGEIPKAVDSLTKYLALNPEDGVPRLLGSIPNDIVQRWEHDSKSKQIAQGFKAETEDGNLAAVEAHFIVAYSLWKTGKKEGAQAPLAMMLQSQLNFKKQASQTTKAFFSKMLNLMPSEMGQDPEIKKIVLEIKKKL